jgi:hypothetical protein
MDNKEEYFKTIVTVKCKFIGLTGPKAFWQPVDHAISLSQLRNWHIIRRQENRLNYFNWKVSCITVCQFWFLCASRNDDDG